MCVCDGRQLMMSIEPLKLYKFFKTLWNEFSSSQVEEGYYYGLVLVGSVVSTVTMLHSDDAIPSLTSNIPWPLQRFCLNRFIKAKLLQISAEYESVNYEKGDNWTNAFFFFH